MIIDTHYHYMRWPAEDNAAKGMVAGFIADAEGAGIKKSMEEVMPQYAQYINDVEADKLVKRMAESGIDITVRCVVDNMDYGFSNENVMLFNQSCARAAEKHPGKLLALAGIDPRRPGAPALFRRCIEEFHMKGLKWHCDHGYYPNSPESYEMLKVAGELGVPLLTHSGALPGTRAKYVHPIHLDDVALDFPGVTIIAAHMGDIVWHEWAALAKYKKSICGDLAMWQFLAWRKPGLFRRYLREILDIVGPGKVLFATDGPVFEPYIPNRWWVETIKSLPEKNPDGITFTDDEVKAILGGNAARIFKL